MVALYAHSDSAGAGAGKKAGVAFLYIFLAFYAVGIDVGTYVYLGEMFPNHMRVKGVGIALAMLNITATIYLSVAGTAFAAVGWKFFLVSYSLYSRVGVHQLMDHALQVFVVITVLGIAWVIFVIPETRQLPLEEIEAVFGNAEDTVVFTNHELEGKVIGDQKRMTEHVEMQ